MHQLKNDIYWTGYIDWDLRIFHGYSTPEGSTYNAYLLPDEKPTLIDTVKYYGFDEMLTRIREVIDPERIEYIVSNHTEMDHSGSIDKLLEICPNAEVVCSPKGAEGLSRHFKKNWKLKVVNNGDKLKIGKKTLQFFLMPMVHWPDSMATYVVEDKVLLPNDAFGQHYASFERYADEAGIDLVMEAAAKYYANIVLPYGAQVQKVLAALQGLDIEMIGPSHGLIWRRKEDIARIVTAYKKWSAYESDKRVTIVYDTMWHSTESMALKLIELLEKESIPCMRMNLSLTHISDAMTQVMNSKVVLIGSPMLNNHVLPTIGGFLTYLKGLKPKNRYAASFGSYGWAAIGFKELEESIKEAGMELITEGRYIKFIPDENELAGLSVIVEKIKEVLNRE